MSNLSIKATKVFEKNRLSDKKIIVNRWGTRSSKTYSILQIAFIWLVGGSVDEYRKFDIWTFSIVRKYSATLNPTIIRDFEDIICANGCEWLLQEWYRSKSEKTYKYEWRTVEFMWADDEQKIRGRKRDILYCNEANELKYNDEFFQLLIRTTYKTFIDFNPDDEGIWINTELEQKRAIDKWDVDIIVSTYKDNWYLPQSLVDEIEYLWKINPAYWRIYGLWEYGKLEGLVFQKREEVNDIDDDYKFLWFGMDFWFSNDPTTLCWVYQTKKWIIFDEVLYKTGLTNQDIVKEFENNWILKTDDIVADCAEPKSIEEIYRAWYNIMPADKWKDSIVFWLDIMKQYDIFVTSRSQNLKRELKSYSWAKDKNWNYINKPIDGNNHIIDGIRYLCMAKLKKSDILIAIHDDRKK
jgi:phage terminase large subunit